MFFVVLAVLDVAGDDGKKAAGGYDDSDTGYDDFHIDFLSFWGRTPCAPVTENSLS